jgi:hypothetical protein
MVLPSVRCGQFAILTEHGPRKDIACTYGFQGDPREANARLIAASPELLAVLLEAQERPVITEKPDWWLRVSAAVTKATGRAV